MHEMSLVVSLLDIVKEEMRKSNASRLLSVRLRVGALANVVPESLSLAFEVLIQDTPLAGARLELAEEALRLACGGCGREFSPPPVSVPLLLAVCPHCEEEFGHQVLAGKALYIDSLEVE